MASWDGDMPGANFALDHGWEYAPAPFGHPTTAEHEIAYAEVATMIGANMDPCDTDT